MIYAAIDPGYTGALAAIDLQGRIVRIAPAPIVNGDYDRPAMLALAAWLASLPQRTLAIEKVNGRPTDGGSRAFNFGRGYEAWIMALASYGLRPEEIPSNLWKARLGLPGKQQTPAAKAIAVKRARELWPDAQIKHDGPAEALLLAHYIRTRGADGMRAVVEQHGKDSKEAWALILGGLNSKNRRLGFRRKA